MSKRTKTAFSSLIKKSSARTSVEKKVQLICELLEIRTLLDGGLPAVTITATEPVTEEPGDMGSMPGVLTLSRSGDVSNALTVYYDVAGSASSGLDYETLPGSITFPGGMNAVDLFVVPYNDGEPDLDETVIVTLLPDPNYSADVNNSATVTITDAPLPNINISSSIPQVNEADAMSAQFTLTRSVNLSQDVNVYFTISGSADNGSDYYSISNSVYFSSYQDTAIIDIYPIQDYTPEPTETVVLQLQSDPNYDIGMNDSATIVIEDTALPTVTILADDPTATEDGAMGPESGLFHIYRSGDMMSDLTVQYSIGGTASNGSDYESLMGSVTIYSGMSSAPIYINPYSDSDSGDETVILTLDSGTGYEVGTPAQATVTIEDAAPPSVTVTAITSAISENDMMGGQFVIERTGNTNSPLTVYYQMSGDATEGTDYSSLSGQVTFNSFESTTYVDIYPIVDSDIGDETVILTLATGTGYAVGAPNQASITIQDSPIPSISVTTNTPTISEDDMMGGQFVIERTGNTDSSLTVYYQMSGDATEGTDYSSLSGQVTFNSFESMAYVYIYPVVDSDTIDESVILTLTTNPGYEVGTPDQATITIENVVPSVSVTASTSSVPEDGTMPGQFMIERTGNTDSSLTVYYQMSGDATEGTDYSSLSGQVTFNSYESTTYVDIIPIVDPDTTDETVILTLTSGTGYEIGSPGQATITIENAPPPTVSIWSMDDEAREPYDSVPADVATFVVSRDTATESAVTVNYTLTGTATNGDDFTTLSGSVTLESGQMETTVTITPINDETQEPYETVVVTLAADVAYEIGSPSEVTITIKENQPPVALPDTYETEAGVSLSVYSMMDPPGILDNDTDDDDDMLSARLVTNTSHGDLYLSSDGSFTYTPDHGFAGTDSFTYKAYDGRAYSNVETVTIDVLNNAPQAIDDVFTFSSSQPYQSFMQENVLDNDTDDDGQVLTAYIVTSVEHGVLNLDPNGEFQYTPDPDHDGDVSFTYRAFDGNDYSEPATVTFHLTNSIPVAVADHYTVLADRNFETWVGMDDVLANDHDPEGNSLTARLLAGPEHGSLNLHKDGSFSYTPDEDYTGTDSFLYEAFDGQLASNPVAVTLTITGAPPQSYDDSFTVHSGDVLESWFTIGDGILGNDTDTDTDAEDLRVGLVAGPTHGKLFIEGNGSFTYYPDDGYVGIDSFQYQAFDGTQSGNVATVTISVVNTAPQATNDSYTLVGGTILDTEWWWDGYSGSGDGLLSNDSDAENDELTIDLLTSPQHGNFTIATDGTFSYFAEPGFTGDDSFTYRVFDGVAFSDPATVTLSVTNQAPAALADSYTVDVNNFLSTYSWWDGYMWSGDGLLSNDTDADYNGSDMLATELSVHLVSGPENGHLTLESDGSFSYTPRNDFVGDDTFTYKVFDGIAFSDEAIVTIQVNNTKPTAQDDSYSLSSGQSLSKSSLTGLLNNDSDTESFELSVNLTSSPQHGQLTIEPDGSFTYIPNRYYSGTDSFTYTAHDGINNSDPATVTITVENSAPVATADNYTVSVGSTLTTFQGWVDGVWVDTSLLQNDSDQDGNQLQLALVSGVSNGHLAIQPDGMFTYTPLTNFTGTDSFVYTLSDGITTSSPASVTITVTGSPSTPDVGDIPEAFHVPPVAAPETYHVVAGDSLSVTELGYLAEETAGVPEIVGVLANDYDPDNDEIRARLVSGTSHGDLLFNTDGTFTYTPYPGYVGTDSFVYQPMDVLAGGTSVTVSLVVTESTVFAGPDAYRLSNGTVFSTTELPGVLANDIVIGSGTLSALLESGPEHGTLQFNSDGTFRYQPDFGFTGTDSFTYTITNGFEPTAPTTVSLVITEAPLLSQPENYTLAANQPLSIINNETWDSVLANDEGSGLTAQLVSTVDHGTLVFQSDGTFVYTPEHGYVGQDTFTYRSTDGLKWSKPTEVLLTVNNSKPTTNPDSYTTHAGTTLNTATNESWLGVLANDSDADNSGLTANLVSGTSNGLLTLNSSGHFIYTPRAGFVGLDQFTYQVGDGTTVGSTATVSIIVTDTNPTSSAESILLHRNRPFQSTTGTAVQNLLTNDSDVDGDSLYVRVVSGATHGRLLVNADGTFSYVPKRSYVGQDSFQYVVVSASGVSDPVEVTFLISNTPPFGIPDVFSIEPGETLAGSVFDESLLPEVGDENDDSTPSYTGNSSSYHTFSRSVFSDINFGGNYLDVSTALRNVLNSQEESPPAPPVSDFDLDEDRFYARLATQPSHGTIDDFDPNGDFEYTPQAGFVGVDTFEYELFDGLTESQRVTVTIIVYDAPPIGVADVFDVRSGSSNQTVWNVLENDFDPDHPRSILGQLIPSALEARLVDSVSHGHLDFESNGSFTYVPEVGFTGQDTFTYQPVGNGNVLGEAVTVTLNVGNVAPTAVEDAFAVETGTMLSENVLENDSDHELSHLQARLVANVSHGNLTLNSNGQFNYTPNIEYVGPDSFTYKISDGTTFSNIVTVSISVTATTPDPEDPPEPPAEAQYRTQPDEYAVVADGLLVVNANQGVLNNDTEVWSGTIDVIVETNPTNGALILSDDGSFEYRPNADAEGEDSFRYKVNDGPAATVRIQIYDRRMETNDDTYVLHAGSSKIVSATNGVLANDVNPDYDTIEVEVVGGFGPFHGELEMDVDGAFIYRPNFGFYGNDRFAYRVLDTTSAAGPGSYSPVAWVDLRVVDLVPRAREDVYTLWQDEDLFVDMNNGLSINDYDADGEYLGAVIVDEPIHGTVEVLPSGAFHYKPDVGFFGTDVFTYQTSDGSLSSSVSSVTLHVLVDKPIALDDHFRLIHGATLNITPLEGLLVNDISKAGNPLTITVQSEPQNGSLTWHPNGAFSYTPNEGFRGDDLFTYSVYDGVQTSRVATVTLTVTNSAPQTGHDEYEVFEDSTLDVSRWDGLLSNDDDGDYDPLDVVSVSDPNHGTLEWQSSGAFTYTPDEGYVGVDSFTYQASDGVTTTSSVVVIQVVEYTTPVSQDDSYEVGQNTPLVVSSWDGILTNDSGSSGKSVTIELLTNVSHGTLIVNEAGSFRYDPNLDFYGTDYFTYRILDAGKFSEESIVRVEVIPEIPGPTPNSYHLLSDDPLIVPAWEGVLAGGNFDGMEFFGVQQTNDYGLTHNGLLTLAETGSLTFTPNPGFVGTDLFVLRNSSSQWDGAVYPLILHVREFAPEIVGSSYSVAKNTVLNVNSWDGLLVGSSDPDGDPIEVTTISSPSNGSVVVHPNGGMTYTPQADYVGSDGFYIRAVDSTGQLSPAVWVAIEVTEFAPEIQADGYRYSPNRILQVSAREGVLSNDTDQDGELLTASLVSDVSYGVLEFSDTGAFTYIPNADFAGEDSFTYQVTDGVTISAVVTVTLQPDSAANTDDAYVVFKNEALSVSASSGILRNDAGGTAQLVTLPSHGVVTLNADGSFTYTPDPDYVGNDSFTYDADTISADNNVATVTLTIQEPPAAGGNRAPISGKDTYTVTLGQSLSVSSISGLLANDVDRDGDPMSVQLVDAPAQGTLTLQSDGSFDYTPAPEFIGLDSFTYQVSDGTDTGEVTQVILSLSSSPIAVDDTYSLIHDRLLTLAPGKGVLANDLRSGARSLSATLIDGPDNGTLHFSADGSFYYQPNVGFVGTDSFVYLAQDGLASDTAVVTLNVENQSPTAPADEYEIHSGQVLVVSADEGPMANDTDADGDRLAFLADLPSFGTLSWNADGSFVYTPDLGFVGTDSFTYSVDDGAAVVTSSVTVNVVNAIPNTMDDVYDVVHNDVLIVEVEDGFLANDTDADGDFLELVNITAPTNGTLSWYASGAFVYTPATDFVGQDVITYQLNDGYSFSPITTVLINVTNDVPDPQNDDYEILHNTDLFVPSEEGLLANDSDEDGDALMPSVVTGPSNGTLTLHNNGSFRYQPNPGFSGFDVFTYQLDDGLALSSVATVTLNVTNTIPSFEEDTFSIRHDRVLIVSEEEGLLANDSDADGDRLTVSLVPGTDPLFGTLELQENGAFVYTPDADFFGTDGFYYQLTDGSYQSAPIAVTLNVENHAPVVSDDSYAVLHDARLYVALWDNEAPTDEPESGRMSDDSQDTLFNAFLSFGQALDPQEDDDENAPDLLGIDLEAAGVVGQENLHDVSQPLAPIHSPSILYGLSKGLLANDQDEDGDVLTITLVDQPEHGTLHWNQTGAFVYVPDESYSGTDSFTYTVSDGLLTSDTATVTIDVLNTAPVTGEAETYEVPSNGLLSIPAIEDGLLANDSDPEGDKLTAVLVSGPQHGTLTLKSNGTFYYQPDEPNGTDSFQYKVTDGVFDSDPVTVEITVTNEAPTAVDDTFSVLKNSTREFGSFTEDVEVEGAAPEVRTFYLSLLNNDTDPNGDTLSVASHTSPSAGTITAFDDDLGTFTITVPDNTNTITFTYRVTDGHQTSGDATVTINVHDAQYEVDAAELHEKVDAVRNTVLQENRTERRQLVHDRVIAQFEARDQYNNAHVDALVPYLQIVEPAQIDMWESALDAAEVAALARAATEETYTVSVLGDVSAYETTVQQSRVAYEQAIQAAVDVFRTSQNTADAAYQQALDVADAQAEATILAARQTQRSSLAQVYNTYFAAEQTARNTLTDAIRLMQSQYQADLIAATILRDQALADVYLDITTTQTQAEADLKVALASAFASYTTLTTTAAQTRQSALEQAWATYQDTVAQAAQTYQQSGADRDQTGAFWVYDESNFQLQLDLAIATYESAVDSANDSYETAIQQAQTDYDQALTTAVGDQEASVAGAISTYNIALQAAKDSYNQATETARQNYDAAAVASQSTFQLALSTARATATNAEQAANQAYDIAANAARDTYQQAAKTAQADYQSALATAQADYETAIVAAEAQNETARETAFQTAETETATALQAFDQAMGSARDGHLASYDQAFATATDGQEAAWRILNTGAWDALMDRQGARQSARETSQAALEQIASDYNDQIRQSTTPIYEAGAAARDIRTTLYQQANAALRAARSQYAEDSPEYQQAQKDHALAIIDAQIAHREHIRDSEQANGVVRAAAQSERAQRQLNVHVTLANDGLAYDAAYTTAVAQTVLAYQQTKLESANQFQVTMLGLSADQSIAVSAAQAAWQTSQSTTNTTLIHAIADADEAWRIAETTANEALLTARAEAYHDFVEDFTIADSVFRQSLASAQNVHTAATNTAADDLTTAVTVAQHDFTSALSAARNAWETELSVANQQFQSDLSVAANAAQTTLSTATVTWQQAISAAETQRGEDMASAVFDWWQAEQPAFGQFLTQTAHYLFSSTNSWDLGSNTNWSTYRDTEATAWKAFVDEAQSAEDAWLSTFRSGAETWFSEATSAWLTSLDDQSAAVSTATVDRNAAWSALVATVNQEDQEATMASNAAFATYFVDESTARGELLAGVTVLESAFATDLTEASNDWLSAEMIAFTDKALTEADAVETFTTSQANADTAFQQAEAEARTTLDKAFADEDDVLTQARTTQEQTREQAVWDAYKIYTPVQTAADKDRVLAVEQAAPDYKSALQTAQQAYLSGRVDLHAELTRWQTEATADSLRQADVLIQEAGVQELQAQRAEAEAKEPWEFANETEVPTPDQAVRQNAEQNSDRITDVYSFVVVAGDTATNGMFGEVLRSDEFGYALDSVDGFFAGVSDSLTAGLSTRLREQMWGASATRNHQGTFFEIGSYTGMALSFAIGFGNPCSMSLVGKVAFKSIAAMELVGNAINLAENIEEGNVLAATFDAVGILGAIGDLARACFTAGTPLLTPEGSKPIEQFQAGDMLLSRDENDPEGAVTSKMVEEVFQRLAYVVHLHVNGQVICTTREHPFYVKGKGWVDAGELVTGDILLSHDGQEVSVDEVWDTGEYEIVYNLRVAEYHTYFVGDDNWDFSVWAHNDYKVAKSKETRITDADQIKEAKRLHQQAEAVPIKNRKGHDNINKNPSAIVEHPDAPGALGSGRAKFNGDGTYSDFYNEILDNANNSYVKKILKDLKPWIKSNGLPHAESKAVLSYLGKLSDSQIDALKKSDKPFNVYVHGWWKRKGKATGGGPCTKCGNRLQEFADLTGLRLNIFYQKNADSSYYLTQLTPSM